MPTLDDLPIVPSLVALKANDLIAVSDASIGPAKVRAVPAALAAQGFTHMWRIDYDNALIAAQTVDDTDQEVPVFLIPANSLITNVRAVVVTPFTGTANTATNVFVGQTDDKDGYVASFDAKTAVIMKQKTGALIDTDVESDFVTASNKYLIVTFDPSTNTQKLSTLTAGSLYVLASITTASDYAGLTTAT